MRKLGPAVILHSLICLTAGSLLAQDTRGNLQGRVLDAAGDPIAAVDLILTSSEMPGERTAVTGSQGYFLASRLPVGSYRIELQRLGYQAVVLDGVTVRLGRTTAVGTVRMAESPVQLDALEATVEPPLIDPVSTAGGANLTPELYENLPTGRDYQAMTVLLPQANESYLGDALSIAGGTGPENKFFIEGVDATDPLLGFESTRLPYNFIREVEVKTGGYEAEYRSSLGGITNVVTYSGGNEFSGRLFGFYSSDGLAGTARLGPSALTTENVTTWDIGGTLGGPILRDRLWFFGAYNPYFHQETVTPTGQEAHDDKTVQHRFAGKLTWRPASRTDVYFTAFGDPATRDAVAPISGPGAQLTLENPDPWLTDREYGGYSMLLGATQLLGNQGLLEGSVSWVTRRNSIQPATERGYETHFQDMSTSTLSGGVIDRLDASMWRAAAWLRTTWELGRHTVKGGFEYYENEYEAREQTRYAVRKFDDDWFVEFLIQTPGTVKSRIPAAYIQDSWLISDRIRVNAGVRWEDQRLLDSGGNVVQRFTDQVQPRIGFVWQPGPPGAQRVYGSAGRFYQDLALNVATAYYNPEQEYRVTGFEHDPREDPTGGEVLYEFASETQPEVSGLKSQNYDEVTLGYERQFGPAFKAGARGVLRRLNYAVEDAIVDFDQDIWAVGNPGRGGYFFGFPRAEREYYALELTAQGSPARGVYVIGSYVLSRLEGNYGGLFMADYGEMIPNTDPSFDIGEEVISYGLLPQDRTHSVKLAISYSASFGLTVGGNFRWLTGTPLSVLGGSTHPPAYAFIGDRGTAGRTPSIWDLDFRIAYDFGDRGGWLSQARLILDVLNVGSPREAVDIDQIQYFNVDEDGNQIDPNPFYGEPVAYQPPMAVRLGLEVGF